MPLVSLNSARGNRIWIFVLMALAVLAFLAMRRDVGRAMKMRAESMAPGSVQKWKPGQQAKIVLELTAVHEGARAQGRLLEKQTETQYRQTPTLVRVAYDSATSVVMGKAADIRVGAAVRVTGTVQSDQTLKASQIVVLTGYVKVD
jgi:hypothetical protein